MRARKTMRRGTAEAGVALLISLFALMLICVVGIALIMASGTDTALTGNYRSATSIYYAALAGLEEGRGRLLQKSPNYLITPFGGSLPSPGQVWYITNPLPGEVVTPWDISSSSVYADNEYAQEFGSPPPTGSPALQSTPSVSAQAGLPGPIYKWVRINPITSTSVALATNINVGGGGLPSAPLVYAGGHLWNDPAAAFAATGSQPMQAIEITALAASPMPNGTMTQRMLQYVVAPMQYNMNFNAALTLDGNGVSFTGPPSNALVISGTDLALPNCNPGPGVLGLGYTNAADAPNITGAGGSIPAPGVVSVPTWQTYNGLSTLVQTIAQNYDVLVNVPSGQTADKSIFPLDMAPDKPKTIVVLGDLTTNGWHSAGYGILVVTGTFTYDPDTSWNGIVLVVGQGKVVSTQLGSGVFNGAVLVANTLGNPPNDNPPNVGPASWQQDHGAGVAYSSCWINAVQAPYTYKVLSFREVPIPTP